MDPALEKLVESGKLTARAADQLEKLQPGTFCLHKSWGFGRVAEWNLLLNQILIDFPGKKAHPMQLTYAAENLTVIPPEHFLAKKASDLNAIKELVKKDPEPLLVLARIYAEQGRMVEAREAVLEALDRDPQNAEALELQRGWKVKPQ